MLQRWSIVYRVYCHVGAKKTTRSSASEGVLVRKKIVVVISIFILVLALRDKFDIYTNLNDQVDKLIDASESALIADFTH